MGDESPSNLARPWGSSGILVVCQTGHSSEGFRPSLAAKSDSSITFPSPCASSNYCYIPPLPLCQPPSGSLEVLVIGGKSERPKLSRAFDWPKSPKRLQGEKIRWIAIFSYML
jgi:hypothetical protein